MDTSISSENMANEIISRVIQNIKEYISLLKPTNSIIIAFDGVAPVAKLEQQRSRRFKSLYTIYENEYQVLVEKFNNMADNNRMIGIK
jgi:5'-3' exonuclease